MEKIIINLKRRDITTQEIIDIVQNFSDFKVDYQGRRIVGIDNDGISEFLFHAMIQNYNKYIIASGQPNTAFKANNDSGEDIILYTNKRPFLKIIEVKAVKIKTLDVEKAIKDQLKRSLEKSFGNTETKRNSVKRTRAEKEDVSNFENNNKLPEGTIFNGVCEYLKDLQVKGTYKDDIAETFMLSPNHSVPNEFEISSNANNHPEGKTHKVRSFVRKEKTLMEVEYE